MTSDDPFPARTSCLFPDCNLSAEEHHRLHRGATAELTQLRARLREPESVALAEVATADLLAELARRLDA